VEATKASGILPLVDGRVPITCSGDTGWQGNGSRCTYNSQSGQTTLCGGITKKVVTFQCFSKLCRTCKDHEKKDPEKLLPTPIHRCPRNWKESSKSMEPHGTVECAKQVWNSCIACMETFCSDDDSSSRAALRHPIQTQINKGYINEWPVDAKSGRQIKSTGRLPAEIHRISTYLVDPSHRRRVYGGQLYKLELKLRVLKKTDCECLIRNFGYAVKQNRDKSEAEFAKAMAAALEHHFDNHEFCNPTWCQFREDSARIADPEKRIKLRNKENPDNKEMYDAVKIIHDENTTLANLRMLMHPYDSKKNEALNRAFTKVALKNIVFSKTYALFDRLAFVICVDLLGYEETLHRLLVLLVKNEEYQVDHVVVGWARVQDEIKLYMQKRQKTKEDKIKRTLDRKQLLMVKRLADNQAKRNGDIYRCGAGVAMLPDSFEDDNGNVSMLRQRKSNLTPEGDFEKQRNGKRRQNAAVVMKKHMFVLLAGSVGSTNITWLKQQLKKKLQLKLQQKRQGMRHPQGCKLLKKIFEIMNRE